MKAKGHHQVADTAGIPLLKEAFGKDKKSINAFYLGNWLTDVSQAVDPIAVKVVSNIFKKGARYIKDKFILMIEEITSASFIAQDGKLAYSLNEKFRDAVTNAEEELIRNIEFLFGDGKSDERQYEIAVYIRGILFLKGYFKFVHPEPKSTEYRMDPDAYFAIFGSQFELGGAKENNPADDRPGSFTQYYPHEHLDRPEIFPSQDPPVYSPGEQKIGSDFQLEDPNVRGFRSSRSTDPVPPNPDLYSYLRDHMQMTAGLLAEVDQAFRLAFENGIDDQDIQWHKILAKLGHALHQVEDFFAHTNWVELAGTTMGEQFLREKAFKIPLMEEIFRRRLLRHYTSKEDDKFQNTAKEPILEKWVVSGYFDFTDAILSLAHLVEPESGDFRVRYHEAKEFVAELDTSTIQFQFEKLLGDIFEFVTDYKRARENDENDVAKSFKNLFKPDKDVFRADVTKELLDRIVREHPLFQRVPKKVVETLFTVVLEGTRRLKTAKNKITLYSAILEIRQFLLGPEAWVKKFLVDYALDFVIDQSKQTAIFYTTNLFYELIGARRIGCHSLLAKDHGSDAEPLYEQQYNCAVAVHWYIVHTLLRWKDPDYIKKNANNPYVDWLELLEFFLRNPIPNENPGEFIPVADTVIHVMEQANQCVPGNVPFTVEELADMYKPTAVSPNFSWRTIADENFGTKKIKNNDEVRQVVDRILRQNIFGTVRKGKRVFKPGLVLRIPEQRKYLFLAPPPSKDEAEPWFKPIFEKDWTVIKGYLSPPDKMSKSPAKIHELKKINESERELLVQDGERMRMEAREKYRPKHLTK